MRQHWQTPHLIQQIVHINTMCHLQRPPGCWLPGLWQQGKGSIPAKLTGRKIKGKDSGETWHRTAANPETRVHPCRKGKILRENIISEHNYPLSRLWARQRRGYTLLYSQISPGIHKIPTWTLHCNANSKPALYPHSPAWLPGSWGRSCRPWRRNVNLSANLGLS